jgi:hypothetical protein
MPGTFKKLDASDIKITPFEAHKQYSTDTDLSSIGAQTASLNWSGLNKSTFTTGSRQYYQIDKLYYRNYIQERANLLELNDANYTTQERRLYKSASLLSLSQKTFGSEVQPESFNLSVTKDGITYNITDDGFGNLYDVTIGKENFPNEDQRVLYLAPVQAFKREDLKLNIKTGNRIVNPPSTLGFPTYNKTVYDDSYFQNVVTYYNIVFNPHTLGLNNYTLSHPKENSGYNDGRIIVQNKPHLNFDQEDFAISVYFEFQEDRTTGENNWSTQPSSQTEGDFLITKEGAQNSPPLGSEAGGDYSTDTTGALSITTTPAPPQFPYRVRCFAPADHSASIELSRFDGDTESKVSAVIFRSGSDIGTNAHIVLQRNNGTLEIYKNGEQLATATDSTSNPCSNKADVIIYSKRLPDGTYRANGATWDDEFNVSQLMIYNKALSATEIINVSQSITGTPNIGNLFYDNGFAVLTHPKYMSLFDGGTLDSLSYKNTHLITEYEYQCTMNENEFEFTNNQSVRKKRNIESEELATFALNDDFKPYVTTVGLYDDDYNLLVVGKLGQPIKASSETDTTFVIRFDT